MLDVFWGLSLGLALFGSVSFGYLVLRFSLPDIRTVSREQKLGMSGTVGAVLFGVSFGLSSVFTDFSFLFFLPLLALIFSAFFEMRNLLFSRDTMQVAVPVVRLQKPTFEYRLPEEKPQFRVLEDRGATGSQAAAEEQIEAPKVLEEIREEEEELRKRAREERRQRRSGGIEEQPSQPVSRPSEPVRRERGGRFRISDVQPEKEEDRVLGRRRRYAERKGAMVEEAKADLMRGGKEKKTEGLLLDFSKPALDLEALTGGIDVSELEKIGSLEELSEAGDISSLESLANINLSEVGGLAEIQQIPKEKGMGCPKCQSSKGTMVYCPYCGKGFCSNCSEKVEAKMDLIFLGCPHCKKEVIVKKA